MKKAIVILITVIFVVGIGGFIFYRYYVPRLVADAIVNEEPSAFVPTFVQNKIKRYKEPVNEGAKDVILQLREDHVDLDDLLKAIDETEPQQVFAAIEALSTAKIENTNQVFDIAKKYFPVAFNIEVLRKPFNENVSMEMIKTALAKANTYDRTETDPEMVKAVVKQILRQKEEEYRRQSESQ